jgi:hypothetical protein
MPELHAYARDTFLQKRPLIERNRIWVSANCSANQTKLFSYTKIHIISTYITNKPVLLIAAHFQTKPVKNNKHKE